MAGSSRPTDPVQLGEEVCQSGGQTGEALNVPSAAGQEGVVVMAVPVSERLTRKIGVTIHPITRYSGHSWTFALQWRDDFSRRELLLTSAF